MENEFSNDYQIFVCIKNDKKKSFKNYSNCFFSKDKYLI